MRTTAAVLYEMGLPTPYAESRPLHIEEVNLEGPGEGEALVEVAAAGLCHSDLSVINGTRPRVMPIVLGHEASGIVREVGPGVNRVTPGDHVVFSYVPMCGQCEFCLSGRPNLCIPGNQANVSGTLLNGACRFSTSDGRRLHHHLGVSAFSRLVVVVEESLVPIRKDMPLEKAALFGCCVLTGVGAVINTAGVRPGSKVAIFGMGGVGLNVLLGARLAGAAQVIAVDIVPGKLQLAKRLGATEVINSSLEDPVSAILDLTSGGVDYAFEAVGKAELLRQAYQVTRRGGTTVIIGLDKPDRYAEIPQVSLVTEERVIRGSYMGSSVPIRDIPRLIDLYLAGLLPVDAVISRHIELENLNAAFDDLASGEVARQVVRFL